MSDKSQASDMASTQASKADIRPVYEVGFHLVPSIPEDGVAAAVESIRAVLGTAEFISEQFPEKMTLAYTIERADTGRREKFTESYFGAIKFALEREAIGEVEVALRGMKNVLRFLLIETSREDLTTPRRAVMAERAEDTKAVPEKGAEVAEGDLDKSIDALVA